MRNIVISGSCKLKERIDYWHKYFLARGYKILASPKENLDCDLGNIYTDFYKNIENTDVLFIMNENQNGIKGYIEPSSFAELTYAIMLNRIHDKCIDIYILNIPDSSLYCYDEITLFINNSWIKPFEFKFILLHELKIYTPFNEQEEKDLSLFFYYIDLYSKLKINSINYLLIRENTLAHFSASAFVVNKNRDKMLVVYHNILDSWIFPGGHADGEEDLLSVAIREVKEETGQNSKPLDNSIFSIQAFPIKGHIKNGEYVSAHIHFDVIFLLEADDSRPLTYRKEESKGVKWITFEEATDEKSINKQILPIHSKLISKFELIAKKFHQDEKYAYETITHNYQ